MESVESQPEPNPSITGATRVTGAAVQTSRDIASRLMTHAVGLTDSQIPSQAGSQAATQSATDTSQPARRSSNIFTPVPRFFELLVQLWFNSKGNDKPNSSMIILVSDNIAFRHLRSQILRSTSWDVFDLPNRVGEKRVKELGEQLLNLSIIWQDVHGRLSPLPVTCDADLGFGLRMMKARGYVDYLAAYFQPPKEKKQDAVKEVKEQDGDDGQSKQSNQDGLGEHEEADGNGGGDPRAQGEDESKDIGDENASAPRRAAVPREGPSAQKVEKRKMPDAIHAAEGQPTFTGRGRLHDRVEGEEANIDESDADGGARKRKKTGKNKVEDGVMVQKKVEKGKEKEKAEKQPETAAQRRSSRLASHDEVTN
ncbi:hypothetical protein BDZ45DRAFT_773874 [Acephala macrosclerotiorum]|nr:hypothetical protein BDZ45DRAFT_773874 [Acephala macrosclerotiorum]